MLRTFEGEARIANLKPVCVTNDLDGTVAPIAPMHHGVDDSLTNHALRNERLILPLQIALGKPKRLRQVIHDGRLRAPDQAEQRIPQFDSVKSTFRIRNPFLAWHANIVDARHWKQS